MSGVDAPNRAASLVSPLSNTNTSGELMNPTQMAHLIEQLKQGLDEGCIFTDSRSMMEVRMNVGSIAVDSTRRFDASCTSIDLTRVVDCIAKNYTVISEWLSEGNQLSAYDESRYAYSSCITTRSIAPAGTSVASSFSVNSASSSVYPIIACVGIVVAAVVYRKIRRPEKKMDESREDEEMHGGGSMQQARLLGEQSM